MRVLSIGTDRKLFEKDSAVSVRNIAYGEKMDSLHIIVFSLKSLKLKEIELSTKVKLYPTNSNSKIGYIFDAIKIGKKIFLEEKFVRGRDVITAQDPFECGFVAWRIAKKFRLPFHLQIHTDFLSPHFKTSILQRVRVILAKFLLKRANGIRIVSKRILDSIKNKKIKLKAEPQILPIRIDIESIEKSQKEIPPESDLKKLFPNFKFIALMASRLTREKRVSDAIYVFSKIVKEYPLALLCIVGEGPLQNDLKKQAEKLNISKNIIFLGWRNDVSLLMSSANMFLSVSEYEGYGMTLVEAGLSGCPVLTTNVGISGDILEHNKNSYICDVGDTICMYEGIKKFITDNAFRYQLSLRLKEDLKNSIPEKEDYISKYVSLLEKISKNI